MKEYRRVTEFSFNGEKYNMYLDKHNKKFFLKVFDDGKLGYVTIEELVKLYNVFSSIPNVMNIEKDSKKYKIRFVPKVLMASAAVTLTASLLMSSFATQQSLESTEDIVNRISTSETLINEEISNYISVSDDELKNDDLQVDTYYQSEKLKYIYIYDMDYINKAFGDEIVSFEMLRTVVANNNNMSDSFRQLVNDYINQLEKKCPDVNLRNFYENLKTLKVIECDDREMMKKTISIDAVGCYIRDENTIYVLEGKEYIPGTWDYQVIFHELSHCLRTGVYNVDGNDVKVQFEGSSFNNIVTSEALNSNFAVNLFDYDKKRYCLSTPK